MAYSPTHEQQKAIELASDFTKQRLKILAYAGAGKTSTVIMIAEALAPKRGIYLAFNKAIADEAGKKLPHNVQAKTFHSLAFGNVSRDITNKLKEGVGFYTNTFATWTGDGNNFYVTGIATHFSNKENLPKTQNVNINQGFKIIKLAMEKFLRSADDEPKAWHIDYSLDNALNLEICEKSVRKDITDWLMPYFERLWADYINPNGHFKITHDVYLKLYALSNPQIQADFILFDEAQDTDSLMLKILLNQRTRIIFVGDPYQQIYEWRGAVDAMQQFEGSKTYLSQSFRFGSQIAEVANHFLKYLGAELPLHGLGNESVVHYKNNQARDINAIICRTNAGAIATTLSFGSENPHKKIYLELSGDYRELLDILENIQLLEDNTPSKHPIVGCFNSFDDLKAYCAEFPNEQEISPAFRLYNEYGYDFIKKNLGEYTSDKNKFRHDTVITTAHKSKGREWDNVLIEDDFEGRSYRYAKDEEGKPTDSIEINHAEARLLYVVITRAKKNLYVENIKPLLNHLKSYDFSKANEGQNLNSTGIDELLINNIINAVDEVVKPAPAPVEHEKIIIKRKYTKRSPASEIKRLEALRIGVSKAVEAGTIGRPSAVSDDNLDRVKNLISSHTMTLKEIANHCNVSLSTIKRIKRSMPPSSQ